MCVDVGVDPHKRSVAAAAVDQLGREVETVEVSNDSSGHGLFVEWLVGRGDVRRVGVEGSGGLGAALARHLINAGFDVREVPASLAERSRRRQPSQGKSDPVDAVAIARVVARDDGLPPARTAGVIEDIKLLVDYRDQLKCMRNQICNRVHASLVVLRPGHQQSIGNLVAKKNLAAALQIAEADGSVRARLICDQIEELGRLDVRLTALEKQIAELIRQSRTSLVNVVGIGALTAGKILGEVGDVGRIRSKGAFAKINGTAPLEASSGGNTRHRLNRGGNRQLNHAIHIVAVARVKFDPETKAYLERVRARGKTKKEAFRCLKRHISNLIYRELTGGGPLDGKNGA